jgi:hypothetical protein
MCDREGADQLRQEEGQDHVRGREGLRPSDVSVRALSGMAAGEGRPVITVEDHTSDAEATSSDPVDTGALDCPFCSGQFRAVDDGLEPWVSHTLPFCQKFSRLDALDYVVAVNAKNGISAEKGRN